MAVIEYMLLRDNGSHKRFTPGFVKDRGHHLNPIDYTLIGWIEDERDFYVPDSIVPLTKEKFIERQLTIHEKFPMEKVINDVTQETQIMSSDEVAVSAGEWYDAFVLMNSEDDKKKTPAPYSEGPSDTV